MAWMLQPHNWTQAVRPNLYNVGYRRNLAYKGMGAFALPPPAPPPRMTYYPGATPTATAYWRLRGLGQSDVTDLPLTNPTYTATNFPTVEAVTYGAGGAGPYTQSPSTTQINWPLLIGGGLLLLLVLRGGR